MNWLDANNILWLIPIPPLVAFVAIILVAGRNKLLSHVLAVGGIVLSLIMSWSVVWHGVNTAKLGSVKTGVFGSMITWLSNGNGAPGSGTLTMGVFLDPLNHVMLFMVPLACTLIFIYSLGYMAHDPRNTRFFAYLSLFAAAMLTLVVADNLLLLFIGWEVMGLCSYLLIGFWYEKESAYKAAIKAFMTTRVADVIFMIGIAYLWAFTGTLNFREIMFNPQTLQALGATPAIGGILGLTAGGLIGICIVIGTIGKSAQFPLHIWLPDAMEGPTPVSAMIHAAAMVSAGVYLVIRMFPVLSAGANVEEGILSSPMMLMAIVGAFTALFAATIALTQNDIKKVLAYSTISQLGFMIAALGIGAYTAAFFHLITHAFFKALLFLGSGSVIHGMEHGHHLSHDAAHGIGGGEHAEAAAHAEAHGHGHDDHGHDAHGHDDHGHDAHGHDDFDPQDMRNMGGLWRKMPVTFITFLIGGMSLAGFPLVTAGFWSKDEIFAEAWHIGEYTPVALVVLLFLAIAAFFTALYTMRQIGLTFFGEPRTEAARYAQHYEPKTIENRNASAQMTAPLIVLAFFAIFAGFAGVNPGFPILGESLKGIGIDTAFGHWVGYSLLNVPKHISFNIFPVIISFGVFGMGAYLGYILYWKPKYNPEVEPIADFMGPTWYRIISNKFYIEETYKAYLVRPLTWVSETLTPQIIDRGIIDRFLHILADTAILVGNFIRSFNNVVIDGVSDGIPMLLISTARSAREMQNGRIQRYLLYSLIAAVIIAANLILIALFPADTVRVVLIIEVIAVLGIALYFYFATARPAASPSEGTD
jgi:NADH-quinone oxidoreductase subunit L